LQDESDYVFVSDPSQVATSGYAKRVLRTAEEKRRIVEATLVPGASIARVARENGVNANQVFQWRYEYRNGAAWAKQSRPELLPEKYERFENITDISLEANCGIYTGMSLNDWHGVSVTTEIVVADFKSVRALRLEKLRPVQEVLFSAA
jgi:hypothetical protein